MRFVRSLVAASILIGIASLAFAQGSGDKPASGMMKGGMAKGEMSKGDMMKGDMTSTLRALEVKVNDTFKNHDSQTFLSMIDPNAMSVDAMGFTPASQVAGMFPDMQVNSYSIEGYKVYPIEKGVYLATYTWKGDGTYKGQPWPSLTYCSSIWAKRGADWKCVFHQESLPMPAQGMQPQAMGQH